MKNLILTAIVTTALALGIAFAGDAVEPQSLTTYEMYRDMATAYSSATYFTQGASMLFSNLTFYSTADLGGSSVIQGLSNVTVEVACAVSSTATGTWYEATVNDATGGTASVTIPALPESSTIYWQARLTDESTNIYYYTKMQLRANTHL
jgi:hypothetical protein